MVSTAVIRSFNDLAVPFIDHSVIRVEIYTELTHGAVPAPLDLYAVPTGYTLWLKTIQINSTNVATNPERLNDGGDAAGDFRLGVIMPQNNVFAVPQVYEGVPFTRSIRMQTAGTEANKLSYWIFTGYLIPNTGPPV